ncbi:MAG: mannonate dehydratase, partial [Planctomycetota bacterium]
GYFLHAVLPAAERAGVRLGLHPDDPPVSPLRGVPRILRSGGAMERALSLSASPSHGLTFCQGTFVAMGEDPAELARRFAERGRIVLVHFRDVRATADGFCETFHDNGPTDMAAMLRLYRDLGPDVPIRVDHVPTLAGEANAEPGYASLGRLFALGYLKGLCEAQGIALT